MNNKITNRILSTILGIGIITTSLYSCGQSSPSSLTSGEPSGSENNLVQSTILDLSGEKSQALTQLPKCSSTLSLVHIQGEVRHFGWDLRQDPAYSLPYGATVSEAHIWIPEYPFTKYLNMQSDENGQWDLYILKKKNQPLKLSFAYEKDFYNSEVEAQVFGQALPGKWSSMQAKSQVFSIEDQDIEDIGMQLPDELYLYYSKQQLEEKIAALIGAPYEVSNFLVATVGKSWASLFSSVLPHGDANAIVSASPAVHPLSGPIYFDDQVSPNPSLSKTSYDGGVLFNSLASGPYEFSVEKTPFTYKTLNFQIADAFNLYIASPPHSLEGSNDSGPKED